MPAHMRHRVLSLISVIGLVGAVWSCSMSGSMRVADDAPIPCLGMSRRTLMAKGDDLWGVEDARKWDYIVIHHSATDQGSLASIDFYHRYERKPVFENGCAYHFVVGNGTGTGDGQVEPSQRWDQQLDSTATRNDQMNSEGMNVCLVGDFEKYEPTPGQMQALRELVVYLMLKHGIPSRRVFDHKDVNPPGSPTECPGKFFPMRELKTEIEEAERSFYR